MELNTNRLLIRPFLPTDITDAYLSGLNDSAIIGLTEARHQSWDLESAKKFISSNDGVSAILLGAFLKNSAKPIGNIRLFNIHFVHRRGELSLLFYDKSEWGKGYATEAINAVINFAFDDLKLHRIMADYYSTNIASSKVFKKTGFLCEGVYKDHFCVGGGQYVDSTRVSLINPNDISCNRP